MATVQETYFHKNLEALQRKQPDLAKQLRRLPNALRYFNARARDGSPVIGLRLPDGKNVALCDANTPGVEAEDWVLGLEPSIREGGHNLLLGFGSAYHPRALFQLSNHDTFIWFVEPDLHLFKYALHLMDYTHLITSPRSGFAVGVSAKEAVDQIAKSPVRSRLMAQGIRVLFHGVAKYLYQEYIEQLKDHIAEVISFGEIRFRTSDTHGQAIMQNCLENFENLLGSAPMLGLLGRAPGVPALVVAPGPSLEEALPLIDRVRDFSLIIAVDTAHRILHRNGIAADFVAAIDFTDLNVRHFETIENDTAYLLAYPGVNPQIPTKYAGRTFFFDHLSNVHQSPGSTVLFQCLKSLPPLGELISYGSTAHAAYHAARYMGCAPIVLVGNDLGYPQGRYYAAGAMQNELKNTGKSEHLEVEANDGGTLMTRGLYKSYLKDFTPLIQHTAGRVVNTSRQGAKIEGAAYEPLEAVIQRFPKQTVDKRFIQSAAQRRLSAWRPVLIDEMSTLVSLCHEYSGEVKQLAKRVRYLDPSDLNFRADLLKHLRTFMDLNEAQRYTMLDLTSSLCQRSILSLLGQHGDVGILGGDTPEKNEVAQQRVKALMKDIDQALTWLGAALQKQTRELQKNA